MRLSDVIFNKSVALWTHEVMFDEKNEVVFVGRSNVGKSSIMNALFEKKDMVKTSSRPGKTKTANLFIVANKYYMTDLPGYGFARLGQNMKEALDGLISWYLEERTTHIKKVVVLIDSRIGAQETDIDMYQYLLTLELPLTIVLSKIDKIKPNELQRSLASARETFFGQEIIPVSSLKKVGVKELTKSIKAALIL
jgi:GTP-binding protein